MIDESQEFKQFAEKKLRRLKKSLKKIFNHPANFPPAFQRGEEEGAKFLRAIVRRLSDAQNNHFYLSFLRLAKAVWLLHKIAFSCEPASAELLRVPAGAHFSAEFMKEQEDLQRSLDAIHQDLHEKRVVAFMLVPGFTLRNSIIKAYVCCVDSFC
ncbi:hypothetical protein KP509_26G027700 [Ceratopteris richardii]|nr:hypothetical protein KP509_26G027700 [Ceratopteris richardii]